MHLWLPKSSAADADAGTGGGGDFMKSYGALRSIQKLMTRKVDAICDKSPDELIKRVRKYLNNINERIQNGSLKGDNLASVKSLLKRGIQIGTGTMRVVHNPRVGLALFLKRLPTEIRSE